MMLWLFIGLCGYVSITSYFKNAVTPVSYLRVVAGLLLALILGPLTFAVGYAYSRRASPK